MSWFQDSDGDEVCWVSLSGPAGPWTLSYYRADPSPLDWSWTQSADADDDERAALWITPLLVTDPPLRFVRPGEIIS